MQAIDDTNREWFINTVSQKVKQVGIDNPLNWDEPMKVSLVGTECSVSHYNIYTEQVANIVVAMLQVALEDLQEQ
jgi:hypothetical protein